jgi:hypothetical protein
MRLVSGLESSRNINTSLSDDAIYSISRIITTRTNTASCEKCREKICLPQKCYAVFREDVAMHSDRHFETLSAPANETAGHNSIQTSIYAVRKIL